jgi:hypothetical protein
VPLVVEARRRAELGSRALPRTHRRGRQPGRRQGRRQHRCRPDLARHLNQLGYEWVVFTATRELIGIFRKLGLSLLALAPADPSRLPEPADDWGSYYDSAPIVVAGRVRLALEKAQAHE